MAFVVDENGDIYLYQGDSGQLVVDDLPTDKNYKLYFSIYNSKRNIINELYVSTLNRSSVAFDILANLTDSLTVPSGRDHEEYYYGLKLCDTGSGTEDTLFINGSDFEDLNIVNVYPKKTEGLT